MPRGIDHLVLACRELDAAADLYRHMGFVVGAENRHPWGTRNRIVQLDGSFLELITTEPGFIRPDPAAPVFRFAGVLDQYLGRRQGCAMLALESADAAADAAAFARDGIGDGGTFFFERKGRRPDGSEVRVAFTLAFAAAPRAGDAGFFVSQQHVPEAFWNTSLQRHANAAARIAGVTLLAPEPASLAGFLAALTGAMPERAPGRLSVDTGRGVIEVVTPALAPWSWDEGTLPGDVAPGLQLVGVRLAVSSLDAARMALRQAGVAHADQGGRLLVAADTAMGVALAFERA